VIHANRAAEVVLKQIKNLRGIAKNLKWHFIYYSHFAQYLAAMKIRWKCGGITLFISFNSGYYLISTKRSARINKMK